MAIDLIFSPASPNNPFEVARRTLIQALARMPVPRPIGSFPVPSDFEGIRDHLVEAASIFDSWLGAVGHQVADNASHDVDMRVFEGAFTGAVEGNATFECDRCAEALIEDRDTMRRTA